MRIAAKLQKTLERKAFLQENLQINGEKLVLWTILSRLNI